MRSNPSWGISSTQEQRRYARIFCLAKARIPSDCAAQFDEIPHDGFDRILEEASSEYAKVRAQWACSSSRQ